MFATRNNQENAVYAEQTATAAKNNGVKGLPPKTPTNKTYKTPFKADRNDENAAFAAGKIGGKGKDGGLFGVEAGGKVKADRDVFVTPADVRVRAPLGAKTGNVKATAFQTPGPPPTQEKLSARPTSPRLRRSKIKVHDADPLQAEAEPEEREIEYMPPREVPLPDYPDDVWPHDRAYPQFEGKNLFRGWWGEGDSDEEEGERVSDLDGKLKAFEAKEAKLRQSGTSRSIKESGPSVQRKLVSSKTPSTLAAKKAVAVFSGDKTSTKPATAASSVLSKARLPSMPLSKRSAQIAGTIGNTRHTAAKVAPNTTLGYSKGRSVSAATRQPLPTFVGTKQDPNNGHAPERRAEKSEALRQLLDLCHLEDEDAGDDNQSSSHGPTDVVEQAEDEETRNFQLEIPED